MTAAQPQDRDMPRLLQRLLDREIDAQEHAQLVERLRADVDCVDLYLQYADLNAMLWV